MSIFSRGWKSESTGMNSKKWSEKGKQMLPRMFSDSPVGQRGVLPKGGDQTTVVFSSITKGVAIWTRNLERKYTEWQFLGVKAELMQTNCEWR